MQIPYCEHKSPRKLCEAVEAVLPPAAGKMARRPYNHFQPTMTSWWLVPSGELPFFKFGKFGFRWDEQTRKTISCGLCVTKGLDPMLRTVYPSKKGERLIMGPDWAWPGFADGCRDGGIARAIREAGAFTEIEVALEGGYVDDPGLFDPLAEPQAMDCYRLAFDGKNSLRVTSAKRTAMTLKALNQVRDLDSFGQTLLELGGNQFLWLNVFIAGVFRVKEYGEFTPEDNVAAAAQIWENVLAKFQCWALKWTAGRRQC